jgi:nucleoside phosphorylase
MVFRCAVELAEAATAFKRSEWELPQAGIAKTTDRDLGRAMEKHRNLERITEETKRLKRILGAEGPLGDVDADSIAGPKWESYEQRFSNCMHDRVVRLALRKLATAAIDLSGLATWRDLQWEMQETGLRLLAWGLSQMWEGLSDTERGTVRDRLSRTHAAIGWPSDLDRDPPPYGGPEDIPSNDEYRIVSNYIACHRGHLDSIQQAANASIEYGQNRFLRRATVAQFVTVADKASKSIRAMDKGDFDSQGEYADLYGKAFASLNCLRRAKEVLPIETWIESELQARYVLADTAGRLLLCVGGSPDAKAQLKPGEAERAFENFTAAVDQLRETVSSTPAMPTKGSEVVVDIGILTIREDEFQAVLDRLPNRKTIQKKHQYYAYSGVATKGEATLGVAVTRLPSQGEGVAQAITNEMIVDLNPRWIFLVGIAGGIPNDEYSLGDVVTATRLNDFSVSAVYQKKPAEFSVGGGPMHREVEALLSHLPGFSELDGWNTQESLRVPKPTLIIPDALAGDEYYGSSDWRKKVQSSLHKNFPPDASRPPKVRAAPVTSSDALIKNADLAEQWQKLARHTEGVEMELAGVYTAVHYAGDQRIVAIRGLSDIVGFKRSGEWTGFACHSAAAFAMALIKSGHIKPRPNPDRPQ